MDKSVKYNFCFFISSLLCIIFFSTNEIVVSAFAEEVANQITLSIQDCISLALKSNLNIRIKRIDPQIQDALLTIAEGRFGSSATFSPSVSSAEDLSSTPGITGANVRNSNSQDFTIGVDDSVVTGGSYGLSFLNNRSDSNSSFQTLHPAYRSGLTLDVTQPLLEGFGISVNKASITIAKNNKDISLLSLKAQLIGTLSEVQDTYWELVFAIENLKVQQIALEQAQDLLKKNQRFKEAGKATASDVFQAQAAVASREADVIAAKDAVKDSEDNLKRVTNMIQDESQWDVPIVPVDTPSSEEINIVLEESIATALENRPEYAQAKIDLENNDISIKVAQNQRLPSLDLEGSLSLNGLGGKIDEPISQVGKAKYDTWYVGLALRMPLSGRVTKAELKKSQLEKEEALISLKDLEQQIITEVRGAVRQLETDQKRIEATKTAEEFARQVLLTEEKKYELGLSTSYELLQFQSDLATAAKNRLRAVIDYRKSIVDLYQALGVTLEKLNIKVE